MTAARQFRIPQLDVQPAGTQSRSGATTPPPTGKLRRGPSPGPAGFVSLKGADEGLIVDDRSSSC